MRIVQLSEWTRIAKEAEASDNAGEGRFAWFLEGVMFMRSYSGVVTLMAEAIADPTAAPHDSCTILKSTGAALLRRAQEHGAARTDVDGTDLVALLGAIGWINDQPSFAPEALTKALVDARVHREIIEKLGHCVSGITATSRARRVSETESNSLLLSVSGVGQADHSGRSRIGSRVSFATRLNQFGSNPGQVI